MHEELIRPMGSAHNTIYVIIGEMKYESHQGFIQSPKVLCQSMERYKILRLKGFDKQTPL